MADKVDTSNIPNTGPDMSSYRAKRINSLHKAVDDSVRTQNKKRMQISTEVSSLTKEQQKLMKQLDMEKSEFTNETASAYNSVVKSLGMTIKNLSVGVKDITLDTAKATSSAIAQYGKAIGEDISINKQNTIAMALSRATPLFGYFAAKFMETDIFRNTSRKIKESLGGAVSGIGENIVSIFRKSKGEMMDEKTPKMQTGGFVKKGGIVEVHAAEVVTPIDKLMKEIDRSKSEEISERLGTTLDTLSKSIIRMETMVGEIEHDRKTVFETFMNEYMKSKTGGSEKPWEQRLLKAVLELKVAMIGTTDRLRIAWQKTLLQHPTFRAMIMISQTLRSAIETPLKALFGLRGGFQGEANKAMATNNVYMKQVNLLALIYTTAMPFLKNIQKYTKVTAEALVGEEVKPTSEKTYTLFGKIKEFMTSRSIKTNENTSFNNFVSRLHLDKGALEEAGIRSFTDLLSPIALLRNMGFTKANIKGKLREGKTVIKSTDVKGFMESNKVRNRLLLGMGSKFDKFTKKFSEAFPVLYMLLDRGFRTIGRGLGVLGRLGGKGAGLAWAGAKTVGKLGLKAGIVGTGLAVAGGMALTDIIRGIMSDPGGPSGFVGGVLTRGLAAFLGGTDTGIAGAKHGAIKGAALGAAVGTIVPGIGTAIGAAIGGAFGGLLGFIGGPKISEAIKNAVDAFKEPIQFIWKVIKFPFHILKEVYQSVWVLLSAGAGKIFKFIDEWATSNPVVSPIWNGIKNVVGIAVDAIKNMFSTIVDKVTKFFEGKGVAEAIKDALLFPFMIVPNFVRMMTELFKKIDGWISGLPVIGNLYVKAKKALKIASTADFSEQLRKALEGEQPVEQSTVAGKDFMQLSEDYANDVVAQQKIIAGELKKSSEVLGKKLGEVADVTKAAAIQTSNTIVSTTSNIVNSSAGQNALGQVYSMYSSGAKTAEKVARGLID